MWVHQPLQELQPPLLGERVSEKKKTWDDWVGKERREKEENFE
jgi:hypothetical protein